MKTFLIPVDYTPASENAMDYAAHLAMKYKAKLVLLHVFHMPVIANESPVVIPSIDVLEKEHMNKLTHYELKLEKAFEGKLTIESKCFCGFATEEILRYTEEHPVDLIIMGMHEAGPLEERLFGSVTTSVLKEVPVPVLTIHQQTAFKHFKKIALACDDEMIENKNSLQYIKELVMEFDTDLEVLHISKAHVEDRSVYDAHVLAIRSMYTMSGIRQHFHFAVNEDIVEGIDEFVTKNKIDLLIMLPKKHSFITDLLHESNTKKMAFHTRIPLLTIK